MSSYTTPYATVEWAGIYFSERANSDDWTKATDANKAAALATATRDIYRYAQFFELVESASRCFPFHERRKRPFKYAYDGTETRIIPDKLKEACCEQALYKLAVNRLDAITLTKAGMNSVKGIGIDRNAIPSQLCDECIAILKELGARILTGAGGRTIEVVPIERIEK